MGYWEKDGGCCFGIDSRLDVSNPLNFGFDEFVATPECAASATTNCGCFFWPEPHNSTPCETGHYHQTYSECMQYYRGNATAVEPFDYVTGVDDEAFLVNHFERLLERAVAVRTPQATLAALLTGAMGKVAAHLDGRHPPPAARRPPPLRARRSFGPILADRGAGARCCAPPA